MMSDGTVVVWNRELTTELLQCKHYTTGAGARFNKAGDELLVYCYSSPHVYVVSRKNGELLETLNHLCEGIRLAHFNHDGSAICTVTCRDGIQIWDRKTGKIVAQLRDDNPVNNWKQEVRSLQWNNAGTKIVAGIKNHAYIWSRHDNYTLPQILLKKLLHLWLQLKKPYKTIDSSRKLLDAVACMLLFNYDEIIETWKSFPENMRQAMWLSMHNKIQKYGK
jgi:WD40 repeat protein